MVFQNRGNDHDEMHTIGRTKMIIVIYHCLFCLTRRAMSDGGFRTSIHIMIEVAKERAYLTESVTHKRTQLLAQSVKKLSKVDFLTR